MRIDPIEVDRGLLDLTKFAPCRRINIGATRYLERYYMGQNHRGEQVWLHRFLAADPNEQFHSHPWYADSRILCGGYLEESIPLGDLSKRHVAAFGAGDSNLINPETMHRIVEVDPYTWSVMRVKPNWKEWCFMNEEGLVEPMGKSHDPDWWKGYAPRPEHE